METRTPGGYDPVCIDAFISREASRRPEELRECASTGAVSGGEPAALNVSLAEDFVRLRHYKEAIRCCDLVIARASDRVVHGFLVPPY